MIVSSKAAIQRRFRVYGVTDEYFQNLLVAQNNACAVCYKPFERSKQVHIDHEHVKLFSKMKPENKIKFVRGLVCFFCNVFLIGKNTKETINQVYDYLMKERLV